MTDELTEQRVVHDKEYDSRNEVVLLKHPLTIDEWNQILQNQKLRKLLEEAINYQLKRIEENPTDQRFSYTYMVLESILSHSKELLEKATYD